VTIKSGDKFHSTLPAIVQAQINEFGQLHGTNGKSHTDPEYAKNSVFGGVIVQGALVMAPLFDIFVDILGDDFLQHAAIETKFIAYTRPGDVIEVEVEVMTAGPEGMDFTYSCALPDGKKVQIGSVAYRPAA
jgi:3-hydroxybutyryl-CoA dehydratase